MEYSVVTVQGRVFVGLLFDETEHSITLADVNGESTVHREDIDELMSNNRSQMPEHLEANLTLQQMADMITFLTYTSAKDP
jgi:hypothetical protein